MTTAAVPLTISGVDDDSKETIKRHGHQKKMTASERSMTGDTLDSTNNDDSCITVPTHSTKNDSHRYESLSDEELISKAEEADREDCILEAGRLLRHVKGKQALQKKHLEMIENAKICEEVVQNLASLSPPFEEGWNKQCELHSTERDTIIYYKLDEETKSKLTCRVDSIIESSLLVPLLSVFNETELYTEWLPRYTKPLTLGVHTVRKLKQEGRARQILEILCDVPWPMSQRQVMMSALPFDEIDANGYIAVKMQTLPTGAKDGLILPPPYSATRVEFDGGLLFRKCPKNHPCLNHSKVQYPTDQHLLLVSMSVFVDPRMAFIPTSVMNFVTRTVIGTMWSKLLHVAEDIRAGNRPQHQQAIAQKREQLYDWVEERVGVLFAGIQNQKGEETAEAGEEGEGEQQQQ